MFFENIKEAIISILSNKMRSLLTMLGIIIGISSVIIITTIGGSIQSTLTATMNSLGSNTVSGYVEARYPEDDADWDTWIYPDMTQSDYVSQEMIDELVAQYPDEIQGIAAENYLGGGQIKDEADSDNYANVSVDGMTPEQFEYMKLEMQAGRNLTRADNLGKKRVCVVADTMAKNYFGDKDPIGETVSVTMDDGSIYDFVVVGVYKYNAALFGKVDTSVREKDRSTYMMIPIQTSFKLQGADKTGYEYFNLLLTPLADVNQATEDIQNYFDEVYQNNTNFHVTASNMQSSMGMINTVLNVITIAVSGIAAISLIVGGVGVMNIMLVSITERTREIGVRMALGAKRRTIRMQFVIEAIMLCLIGGIIGILIGGVSGYFGGWVDTILMRVVDVVICIPAMPLYIIIGSVMDYYKIDPRIRIYALCAILGIVGWPGIARMVRGQILSLREQEFMVATEATGVRISRRIFRHLIPNVIPQLIVIATMGLGDVILMEATLSFLGIGVKFPYASWGNIVNAVNDVYVLTNFWFVWIPAGFLILLTVLGFNFVGDGLRDAFDPKMKR